MPKRIVFLVLPILLWLSACQGKVPAAPEPTQTLLPTQTPPAVPTAVAPTNTAPAVSSSPTKEPGCTVVSLMPTPGPTQQSLFPAKMENDQVQGPDTASVTIIEYSDFQ